MALFSNTLIVIRHYLSSAVGDLVVGTADSGSSTTLVDTMLRREDDWYNKKGYECYIYEGVNVGEAREVADWERGINTLTLAPAYSSALDTTSKYELHFKFTESEYCKAINQAIEHITGAYLVNIKDETTITLVADTYEYALPLSMLYLYRVITEKEADGGIFDASDEIDPRTWSIIKSYPPKLKLHEDYYPITVGKDLRLEGQGAQPIVDDDTDIIYLPPDWLVQKAITLLPQNKIQSGKLDETYRRAERFIEANEPTARAEPSARRIVE